jgi:hypothetical protein
MKIGKWVASALFFITFLLGSLFLINFLKASIFVYLYFAFAFLLLIAIALSLRKAYPENINLLSLIIPVLLIGLALTFFGTNVKLYTDTSKNLNDGLDSASQISNLEKTNEYYLTYIDFLNDEILKAKKASSDLQAQINDLTSQKVLNPQVQNTTQETPPIIIREREEEEEDDD